MRFCLLTSLLIPLASTLPVNEIKDKDSKNVKPRCGGLMVPRSVSPNLIYNPESAEIVNKPSIPSIDKRIQKRSVPVTLPSFQKKGRDDDHESQRVDKKHENGQSSIQKRQGGSDPTQFLNAAASMSNAVSGAVTANLGNDAGSNGATTQSKGSSGPKKAPDGPWKTKEPWLMQPWTQPNRQKRSSNHHNATRKATKKPKKGGKKGASKKNPKKKDHPKQRSDEYDDEIPIATVLKYQKIALDDIAKRLSSLKKRQQATAEPWLMQPWTQPNKNKNKRIGTVQPVQPLQKKNKIQARGDMSEEEVERYLTSNLIEPTAIPSEPSPPPTEPSPVAAATTATAENIIEEGRKSAAHAWDDYAASLETNQLLKEIEILRQAHRPNEDPNAKTPSEKLADMWQDPVGHGYDIGLQDVPLHIDIFYGDQYDGGDDDDKMKKQKKGKKEGKEKGRKHNKKWDHGPDVLDPPKQSLNPDVRYEGVLEMLHQGEYNWVRMTSGAMGGGGGYPDSSEYHIAGVREE